MSRWVLGAVLGLSGCWVGSEQVAAKVGDVPGETDTDTDTDTEVVWDPLELGGLEPGVGTNAGGTTVTIDVGPLDPDTEPEVTFGGVPAVVQVHDGDSVTVSAPAVGVEGSVDVTVSSAGRTARASGGFYYWADGAGRVGLVGQVNNYDFERSYEIDWLFSDVPEGYSDQMHDAGIRYVEPVDTELWREYTDTFDSCRRNFVYDGPTLNVLKPGLEQVRLQAGSAEEFVLQVDDNDEEYVLPLSEGWIPASRGLSLEQDAGDSGWFAYQVDDVVTLPSSGFRVVSPAAQDTEARYIGTSFDLRWEGGAPGEVVLVRLYRYEYPLFGDAYELRDIVSCALADDGHHRIRGDLFRDVSLGFQDNLLTIRVGRVLVEDSTLPTNRARVGVYGMHWWYGAAYMD